MTLARRLAAVESSLTPTQLVLRMLDEAHAHGGFVDYCRALLDVEPDEVPINRLCREARRAALSSIRGRAADQEAKAVTKAQRETLFRFFLAMRINVVTHEVLEKELYVSAAMASFVAMLVAPDKPADDYDEHLRQASLLLVSRVATLDAHTEARAVAAQRIWMAATRCSPRCWWLGRSSCSRLANRRPWLCASRR